MTTGNLVGTATVTDAREVRITMQGAAPRTVQVTDGMTLAQVLAAANMEASNKVTYFADGAPITPDSTVAPGATVTVTRNGNNGS